MCIRILHVVGSMDRGGAETMLMNLYRKMDRETIQFDFVVHGRDKGDFDEEILSLGGKVYHMPRYNGRNHFIYVKRWHQFFLTHPQYSIVHGHIRSTAAIYLKLAKEYGRVAIAHSHSTSSRGNLVERVVKKVMQYPIRHIADYFFACSKEAGIWLFGGKACQGRNFKVLSNAIDSEKFAFSEETRGKVRKELGIGGDFVVGHVGNFDPVKNHGFLIDIFNCLCKKEAACSLLLVGGGDMALQRKVAEKARDMELSEKVMFLGKRDDVDVLLNAFDIFLFPSIHEGLPLVVVEAQANGLMCLLSDGISKEVAITENVCFTSLEEAPEAWVGKILPYMEGYERRGMQGVIRKAGYDANAVAKWVARFYLSLQGNSYVC